MTTIPLTAPTELEGWEKLGKGAYYPALLFTLIACGLTFHSMTQHILQYRRPDVQRLILRIFWMYVEQSYPLWPCLYCLIDRMGINILTSPRKGGCATYEKP
jgi:hypothetical protein